jgi:hypothetical protein
LAGLIGVVALIAPVGLAGPAAALPAAAPAAVPARAAERMATAPLAVDVLAGLPVKGRAPKTDYRRALYGDGWSDADGDGCWTREEILQRDLTKKTYRKSGRCLVIVTGVLKDPYTGRTLAFRRGSTTSSLVQIDHVVALMDSWQKGGRQLTPARRAQFANDPMNLLAVEGKVNQGKGASDAATWLPPSTAYRCSYVARQVAVKARYSLWVTAAEKAAIARILTGCPGQRVPTA